ncbi:MAG: aldo/keto reductase [Desulfobacterales bacterium]|nr:aldo/keto reductase [Desulfobacterales bacterium]
MKYRKLGKTGLSVSVIGMGTFQFGGSWGKEFTQADVDEIIDAGRESGINLIDTAECYGDHLAEKFIGNSIKTDRTGWIVATKFGHRPTSGRRLELWSADEVRIQLEDSLKALQTDYVDLYQFHTGPNKVFDNDALWTMLDKQVQAGKIRFLGISVSTGSRDDQRYQTDRATEVGASAIQVRYNRLVRDAEETVLPSCKKQGLGVLVRVPLESGFLTGKYQPGATFAPSDLRSRRFDTEELNQLLAEVSQIREKEVPPDVSMPAWALAWCLKHPDVTCVIPGSKRPENVRENAAAADLTY